MPYDAQGNWKDEDTSVSTRLNQLTSKENPYMQQARAMGQQTAARRGLLNSSIAGTAGEAAAIQSALPMASQEASQASQRNLAQLGEQGANSRLQQQLAATQRNTDADIASREKVATQQQAGSDRERALAAATQMGDAYSTAVSNLLANDKIPESVRSQYLQSLQRQYDSNLALIEQIQGVDLTWGSSAGTGTGSGGLGPGLAGASTGGGLLPASNSVTDALRAAGII